MAYDRLTTVTRVKEWLSGKTGTDDNILTRLVDQASRLLLSYLERPTIFYHTFTEIYDGKGNHRQFLANWPVISVASVYVANHNIPAAANMAANGQQCGYYVNPAYNGMPPGSPQSIDLYGFHFHRGNGNVQITYTAGYYIANEPQTIAPGQYSNYKIPVNAPYGHFGKDNGVTYASTGIALINVPFTATPATGTYCVDEDGNYNFSATDNGLGVLINYSYVPSDLEIALIEWVADRYRYKSRIGEKTNSVGGTESTSYAIMAIPDFVKLVAEPYRKVIFV